MTAPKPEICIMYDIESLDTGPRSIVSQIAYQAFPTDDPETVLGKAVVYLPIQPQIELKRTVSADTLVWWMQQSEEARQRFAMSTGDEFETLPALLRFVTRKFIEIVGDKSYEIWARGPQFDIVNIESLMADVAVKVPWRYDRVRDLRTLMAMAGLSTSAGDVPRPADMPLHMADHDCRYQILCYAEAIRHLTARS